VKKTTAIFFFLLYMLSTTEACQLLKLPYIFQHFREHKMANRSISFLQFLDIHYKHCNSKPKDYQKDMQLPFKTATTCISSVLPTLVPPMSACLLTPITRLPHKKILIPNKFLLIPSAYLSNIWQPPKY
jgi:hypothetical protein